MKTFYGSVFLSILILSGFLYAQAPEEELFSGAIIPDRLYCERDEDCACGVDSSGNCAFGNKAFIDTSRQCPDFCTGIHGRFRLRCINNRCEIRLE